MKSIKQIMEEMGFNKNAPVGLQKAFIRHLISAANQVAPLKSELKEQEKPMQLEFEFPEDKRVS